VSYDRIELRGLCQSLMRPTEPNSQSEVNTMEASSTVATGHPQGKTLQSRQEALTRAVSGQSFSNFPAIFQGFAAKGIPEPEIKLRKNAFTFDA
jgi:hypothetical protein